MIRATRDLATFAPELRAAVRAVDASQPIGMISAVNDLIAASVAPRRLSLWVIGTFAAVALTLTAFCLYGLMAYLVSQRTREIGVRMALGASRRDVLALVLGQAVVLTCAGIAAGVVGALVLTRSAEALLFGVSASDPTVYLAVSTLLAVVALVAAAVPSSRAARVNPITALR